MPKEIGDRIAYEQALEKLDLNELLKDADLNALLKELDLNKLLDAYNVTDLLTDEQLAQYFGNINLSDVSGSSRGFGRGGMGGGFSGFGGRFGPRNLESSSDVATADFMLSKDSTGFTNVQAIK